MMLDNKSSPIKQFDLVLSDLMETRFTIDHFLKELISSQEINSPRLKDALLTVSTNAGKRLRPHLVFSCASLLGLSKQITLPIAAAIELVHCYSLIHDDLPAMDNSDLRWGKPSCWKFFDEATAILTGDALLTLSFELLSKASLPPGIIVHLIKKLAQAAGSQGMVDGQMLDLFPITPGSLDNAIIMQNLKTGCLLSFSCESAAIITNASEDVCGQFSRFGMNLGLIYQIVDDLLDKHASPDIIGKPVMNDLTKQTPLSYLGEEKARILIQEKKEECLDFLSSFPETNRPLIRLLDWIIKRQY
jgi:farnesyl diphosphate synthase